MLRILALLGVFPLVWTTDDDGEIRLRVARFGPTYNGQYTIKDGRKVRNVSYPVRWWCASMVKENPVLLLPEGKTGGAAYVKSWQEWWGNRKHITITGATERSRMLDEVIKEISEL